MSPISSVTTGSGQWRRRPSRLLAGWPAGRAAGGQNQSCTERQPPKPGAGPARRGGGEPERSGRARHRSCCGRQADRARSSLTLAAAAAAAAGCPLADAARVSIQVRGDLAAYAPPRSGSMARRRPPTTFLRSRDGAGAGGRPATYCVIAGAGAWLPRPAAGSRDPA